MERDLDYSSGTEAEVDLDKCGMKHGREYSQGKKAEKKNRKNHKEVCKIFEYLERKLPSGWKMNEGEMKIRNQSGKVMLHTFCKAEDDLEKDTK